MLKPLTIICDTREQNVLGFDGIKNVIVVRQGLKTGDYSIQGYEDAICFERKSIPDLVGTLSKDHERFVREIYRMKDFEQKYILVEHTASKLFDYCMRHGWEEKFNTTIQSLLAYACYGVRVRFCKDRENMEKYIVRKSREFLKEKEEQCQQQQTSDLSKS